MYPIFLLIHSWLRWILVIVAVATVARACAGWLGKRAWTSLDDRLGMAFTMAMDLQTLFGLILYFALSPLMKAVFADFGAAMGNSTLRYWSMEHIFGMVVALALAHVGRARSRKAFEAVTRHKEMAIFCGLAILVILVTIPWPFMPYTPERPWFRAG